MKVEPILTISFQSFISIGVGQDFCYIWWLLTEPFFVSQSSFKLWVSSQSSWVAVQPGCWEEHLPVRWWHRRAVCSTPRHYGQPAEGDGGWFLSSCCHEQRCPPTRGSQVLEHQSQRWILTMIRPTANWSPARYERLLNLAPFDMTSRPDMIDYKTHENKSPIDALHFFCN